MTNEEIVAYLNSLSEDEMIEKVILPLYKKRFANSFRRIEFSGKDKREDEGIDITFYEMSRETSAKEYCGVQVKQGAINNGKGANGVAALSVQADQAFNKKISDTDDKKTYKIHAYTILTTGVIQAKARAAIVDRFEHKPIRFIDGEKLCEWIRESFSEEIRALAGCQDDIEDGEGGGDPADVIIEYLKKNFAADVEVVSSTLAVLDGAKKSIVCALMENGGLKTVRLARAVGRTVHNIEDDLSDLCREELLDVDEEGYSLGAELYGPWRRIERKFEERVVALGYDDDDVTIGDIIERLF